MMSDYIGWILAQALIGRRPLRNVDPWKSIEEVQSANRGIHSTEVENAVGKAVKAVRKAHSERLPAARPTIPSHP